MHKIAFLLLCLDVIAADWPAQPYYNPPQPLNNAGAYSAGQPMTWSGSTVNSGNS